MSLDVALATCQKAVGQLLFLVDNAAVQSIDKTGRMVVGAADSLVQLGSQ